MTGSSPAIWRKSSYSGDNGGNCVEVGDFGTAVAVRDSKNVNAGMLVFSRTAWSRFIADTRAGRYDVG
jgi:hypothetical protein